MNRQIQCFVDKLVSGHLADAPAWDNQEAIAGIALAYGWPADDCLRLAQYVIADRETLRIAMLCAAWPNFDYGPCVEGVEWGRFEKFIPFFVGPADREVHFPAEEAPEPTQSRMALDSSFDEWAGVWTDQFPEA